MRGLRRIFFIVSGNARNNTPVRKVIHNAIHKHIPVDNHQLIHRVLHNYVDNLQTGRKRERRNREEEIT